MPKNLPEENVAVLPEDEDFDTPSRINPVGVLGFIALFCAIFLIGLTILCIPYFGAKDEPQPELAVPASEAAPETTLETEETEPEVTTEPTIPPEANPYNSRDFQYNRENYLLCTRQDSYPGIDVSAYQHEIDWKQVSRSGIRFAIVRLGYRGYGQAGKIMMDDYARRNLDGAAKNGIAVGAYFFSQALDIAEVDEEISFMLEILGDRKLDMPIILDWEIPEVENPRTANMDARTLTDCMLHYCQVMEEKGYQPMVYFNKRQASRLLYLHELEDYPFWLAYYSDRMDYPFRVEMWQYTSNGTVPGIADPVDINVYMPDLRYGVG